MNASVTNRTLLTPASPREALRMLRDERPLTPMAGCTDLYVSLNFGTLADTRFLNLWKLADLRRIDLRGTSRASGHGRETLRIGALVTYTELIHSRLVGKRLPMLVAAAREVGGVQIQNRGTIGGNIANASPAGDTLPVFAAADAIIVLQSMNGERRVPLTTFYTGYRQTLRRQDELIVAVEVPLVEGRQWFRKVGTRAAQAISKVVVAGVVGEDPRVAIGSVAPTVLRLPRTEAAIARRAPIEEAQRTLLAEIAPIDDIRSTAEYRRHVAARLLARMLTDDGGRGAQRAVQGARG